MVLFQRKLAHFSNWRCDRVLGDVQQKVHCADFWGKFKIPDMISYSKIALVKIHDGKMSPDR